MMVSVIVPCYRSESTLQPLVSRLCDSLAGLESVTAFEIILVVDGSPDDTGPLAVRLSREIAAVTTILFRRNFGQHNALIAGVRAARYDIIVTLDDDLQHPPEEIVKLLEPLDDPSVDLVYGVPEQEQHGMLRSVASRTVKQALTLSGVANARWVGAFRAFRTELRDGFSRTGDAQVNLDVLLSWVTAGVRAVPVRMEPRPTGRSTYGVLGLLRHTIGMVTGYGVLPLRIATWLGIGCGLLGAIVLLTVLVRYFTGQITVPGFTTLAALITLFAGAQMLSIGIIGEYLGRQHFRSMSRPMYVIGSVHGGEPLDVRDDESATGGRP
jgi:glycosyltransferase involved in cell wall biosynthesis